MFIMVFHRRIKSNNINNRNLDSFREGVSSKDSAMAKSPKR